jgi:acetyl esterase/lipase
MEHLLHSKEILPSSITLVGDSAGAHLLLSLVLHLTHPNPRVSPLEIDGRLSGAILVSPWVNMASSSDSMKSNEHRDILSAAALVYWAQNFLGGSAPDPWNSPLTAPTEWWSNLPIDDMLITYGEDELLRDDTSRLCEILQTHHAQTTTALEFSGELHVHMVINRLLRINKSCESEKVFVNWLNDHLSR